jgi:hypothetical protein
MNFTVSTQNGGPIRNKTVKKQILTKLQNKYNTSRFKLKENTLGFPFHFRTYPLNTSFLQS